MKKLIRTQKKLLILHKFQNYEKPKLTGPSSVILPNNSPVPAGIELAKYSINYNQMFYSGEELLITISDSQNLPIGLKMVNAFDVILYSKRKLPALEDLVQGFEKLSCFSIFSVDLNEGIKNSAYFEEQILDGKKT